MAKWLTLGQQQTFWLPDVGSQGAANHDVTFYAILYTTGFFFFLVVGLMLFFIVKYRRRPGSEQQEAPTHNTPLEIAWTAVPLIVVITFFTMGFIGYMDFEVPPTNCETVEVLAGQWSFSFTYANGGSSDVLYVPQDKPVRLLMRSKDVTHALYIPAFRVQRNIVPGRTIEMWFRPTQLGEYQLACTQYCGDSHSTMVTKAVVLDSAGYAKKLNELSNPFKDASGKPLPFHVVGENLRKQLGCVQCHSVDGTPGQGPSWKGAWKTDHAFAAPPGFHLSPANSDKEWEDYLSESMLNPGAKIVQGYQNVMPPFESQLSGSPAKDLKRRAIIEYIKSLNTPDYKPVYPDLGAAPGGAVGAGAATGATTGSAGAASSPALEKK